MLINSSRDESVNSVDEALILRKLGVDDNVN